MPKKKISNKKGDLNKNYNSSMGVSGNLKDEEMINGMSVKDAMLSFMRFKE